MQIRHERPMSDLSFQVRAPLGLELSTGERLTITEWSLAGFDFPGEPDVMPKEAVLSIPFQGVDIRFPITLTRQGSARFLSFEGLTGRQRETLAVFYRSILSGKMASTEEVITSLDTPVDLVPMGETEEEKAAGVARSAPRALRAVLTVLLYACIAAVVAWTLGAGLYAKLATVEILNARVEAAMLPHPAADRAFVKEILVAPGDRVERGDILVRLVEPRGAAALDEVRGRITLIEDRLAAARATEARLGARIATLRAEIVAGQHPGFAGVAALLAAFDGRYAAAYRDLFDAHGAALAQIDSLDDELRRLKRERGQLRDAGDALHVMAQDDGVVATVDVLRGQLVGRGATVALVEGRAARQARGWLDPAMAGAVFPGMAVRVEVATAAGPRALAGRVAVVEAGVDPEISAAFGLLVTVAFTELSAEDTRVELPHLVPVTLRAQRPWAAAQAARVAAWRAELGL